MDDIHRKSIAQKFEEFVGELNDLDDWPDRLEHIIEMGSNLPPLYPTEKVDEHLVIGCKSKAWLISRKTPDGFINLRGTSEAPLPRGLIAIIIRLYSGHSSKDIHAFDGNVAFQNLGVVDALTTQRARAIPSFVHHLKKISI